MTDPMTSFANTAAVASRTLSQRLKPHGAGGWVLQVAEVKKQSLDGGEAAKLPLLLRRGSEELECGWVDFFSNQCQVRAYRDLTQRWQGRSRLVSEADYRYLVEQLANCVAAFNLKVSELEQGQPELPRTQVESAPEASVPRYLPVLLGVAVLILVTAVVTAVALMR